MLMNALASLSRWSFATDSRKPSRECPRRVLHMQRVPEIQHAWKSNDSCPQPALITRSSWNRSFLANAPHEKPAATVYRTGGSGLLQWLHSPGHSLSTECPSRRVCHCSPRFLTIHFLGHREAWCTHCKRPIVKHDRTEIDNNEKNKRARKFVCVCCTSFILYFTGNRQNKMNSWKIYLLVLLIWNCLSWIFTKTVW